MDTYSFQRWILQQELLPTEKLVGMALALHIDRKTGKIRVRQEIIAQECGVSTRTVRRAIASLVAEGILSSQQTGRSAVLVPLGKKCGIVDRPPVDYQIGHQCPTRRREKTHFDLDTSLSTRVEELNKRDEKRFQREQNERTISDT
jgi:predicted ArsR family transcriptional regulator